MRIYISMPITGHDPEERRAKAGRFAMIIYAIGHDPVNPFDVPPPNAPLSDEDAYAYYIAFDIADLLRSDAVYFSRGWQQSKACRLMHAAAEIYGIKIYYKLDKIPEAE